MKLLIKNTIYFCLLFSFSGIAQAETCKPYLEFTRDELLRAFNEAHPLTYQEMSSLPSALFGIHRTVRVPTETDNPRDRFRVDGLLFVNNTSANGNRFLGMITSHNEGLVVGVPNGKPVPAEKKAIFKERLERAYKGFVSSPADRNLIENISTQLGYTSQALPDSVDLSSLPDFTGIGDSPERRPNNWDYVSYVYTKLSGIAGYIPNAFKMFRVSRKMTYPHPQIANGKAVVYQYTYNIRQEFRRLPSGHLMVGYVTLYKFLQNADGKSDPEMMSRIVDYTASYSAVDKVYSQAGQVENIGLYYDQANPLDMENLCL